MTTSFPPIIAGFGPLGTPELIILAFLLAVVGGVIALIIYASKRK